MRLGEGAGVAFGRRNYRRWSSTRRASRTSTQSAPCRCPPRARAPPANPVFAERLVPADQGSPALQPPPQYLPTLAPGTARGSHCTPLQRGRAEAGRRAGHVLKSRQPRSDWGPWSAQAQGPTPTREARLEIFHRH